MMELLNDKIIDNGRTMSSDDSEFYIQIVLALMNEVVE